jgi:hypothetical protein
MKIRLTSMLGQTKDIDIDAHNKTDVLKFIELYKNHLGKNQRVKITCDVVGVDGYLQGTR